MRTLYVILLFAYVAFSLTTHDLFLHCTTDVPCFLQACRIRHLRASHSRAAFQVLASTTATTFYRSLIQFYGVSSGARLLEAPRKVLYFDDISVLVAALSLMTSSISIAIC